MALPPDHGHRVRCRSAVSGAATEIAALSGPGVFSKLLGEDVERLRRLGVRVLFGPDVLVLHRPRQGKRDQFLWYLTVPALKEALRMRCGNRQAISSSYSNV